MVENRVYLILKTVYCYHFNLMDNTEAAEFSLGISTILSLTQYLHETSSVLTTPDSNKTCPGKFLEWIVERAMNRTITGFKPVDVCSLNTQHSFQQRLFIQ